MICVSCGGEFEPDKWHPYQRHCSRRCRSRSWRAANPKKSAEYNRRHRERDPEAANAYWRAYYADHREDIRARQRRQYHKHKERRVAYRRTYAQGNREKKAAQEARRRARKRGLPDTLTAQETEKLLAIGRTMFAGEELHLDHIVPLSKGGGTTLANMHAIPKALNLTKFDRLPEEVYRQLRFS